MAGRYRAESWTARALSAREREVLTLAARGLSYKEIARRLGISTRTARNHITNIYGKLDVHDRSAAALSAVRLGLVEV
jgi:DNA-binding CsgD family transcriptional regulator